MSLEEVCGGCWGVMRLVEVWGLVVVWGGWWRYGEVGGGVGRLVEVWGGCWRCGEAGGGMEKLVGL